MTVVVLGSRDPPPSPSIIFTLSSEALTAGCAQPSAGSRHAGRAAERLLSGHLHNQQLLLLPGGLDGQDRLSVLVLDHLQGDLRVPALVLRASEVDLLPFGHDHREVNVFALPLHAVHRLHVGEVQLLHPVRAPPVLLRVVMRLVVLLRRQQKHAILGQDAVLLLPELQQPVAPLLQQTLLEHLPAVFQHIHQDPAPPSA